jgi:mRNA interferase YafQ
MKYRIKVTPRFEKAYSRCIKRGLDINKMSKLLKMLENGESLPPSFRRHKLSGKYKGCLECHIEPDWLLIWMERNKELVLVLIDTGTHSDLF